MLIIWLTSVGIRDTIRVGIKGSIMSKKTVKRKRAAPQKRVVKRSVKAKAKPAVKAKPKKVVAPKKKAAVKAPIKAVVKKPTPVIVPKKEVLLLPSSYPEPERIKIATKPGRILTAAGWKHLTN